MECSQNSIIPFQGVLEDDFNISGHHSSGTSFTIGTKHKLDLFVCNICVRVSPRRTCIRRCTSSVSSCPNDNATTGFGLYFGRVQWCFPYISTSRDTTLTRYTTLNRSHPRRYTSQQTTLSHEPYGRWRIKTPGRRFIAQRPYPWKCERVCNPCSLDS